MTAGGVSEREPRQGRRIPVLPTTRLGKWALGLAAASFVVVTGWQFMGPLGGIPGFVLGIAAGVVALVAILRRGERALAVHASLLPLVNVVVFLLAEFIVGHE